MTGRGSTDTERRVTEMLMNEYFQGADDMSLFRLCEEVNVSRSTMHRALASAIKRGTVVRVQRGVYRAALAGDRR